MEKVAGLAASPSREAVIGALENCYDPCCRERKISVVDMGLIESIDIEGRRVEIEMVLTTGWCPFAFRLLEIVTEEVGALPAVDSVDVDVVWNPTWTPERMAAYGSMCRAPRHLRVQPRPRRGLCGPGSSSGLHSSNSLNRDFVSS